MKEANNQIETDNLSQENVNATKRKISEGMDLIKQRQKLIKLADSSDADWRVVDEYIANPLADDSDDEKKIYKVQSRRTWIHQSWLTECLIQISVNLGYSSEIYRKPSGGRLG
jgi:hypothetical protein